MPKRVMVGDVIQGDLVFYVDRFLEVEEVMPVGFEGGQTHYVRLLMGGRSVLFPRGDYLLVDE